MAGFLNSGNSSSFEETDPPGLCEDLDPSSRADPASSPLRLVTAISSVSLHNRLIVFFRRMLYASGAQVPRYETVMDQYGRVEAQVRDCLTHFLRKKTCFDDLERPKKIGLITLLFFVHIIEQQACKKRTRSARFFFFFGVRLS